MKEQELIRLLRASPEEGYKAVFDEYWSYVYAISHQILHRVGSREDIEDCVVDSLCDAMQHFDPGNSNALKAYIGSTARNKAISMYRTLTSHPTVSLEDTGLPEHPDATNVEESVERSETAQQVMEQIRALGEPDAAIILHKYFYGHTSTEIARILHMNPITVRSRCSRAVRKLREALAALDITL